MLEDFFVKVQKELLGGKQVFLEPLEKVMGPRAGASEAGVGRQ